MLKVKTNVRKYGNIRNIFEFKVDKPAQEALQQIEDKGYAAPFAADSRQVFKIGVSFDSGQRNLAQWLVN